MRELNVYSELLPHDTPLDELEARGVRAIILSGGPKSVYDEGAPKPDASIWSGRLPVLGICYGAQLMALELGGDVLPHAEARVRPGDASRSPKERRACSPGIDREQPVWMSHGDSITRLPEGFTSTAQTDSTPYAGLEAPDRNLYGIQFHPEVAHTPRGKDVLRNFVTGIARHRAGLDVRELHRHRPSPRSATGSTSTRARPAPTARSSARCRAAWTPRSPRPSSIARSATG